jgi:hypothetical protein
MYYTVFWWCPIKGIRPSAYPTGVPFLLGRRQCLCFAKVFLSHLFFHIGCKPEMNMD